jgi:hypothetical protein
MRTRGCIRTTDLAISAYNHGVCFSPTGEEKGAAKQSHCDFKGFARQPPSDRLRY